MMATAPCAPTDIKLATLEAKVQSLETEITNAKKDRAQMKDDLKAIRSKIDRWSGVAGLVALGIPAGIAALVGYWIRSLKGD